MKATFLILSILYTVCGFCQSSVSGIIKDSKTNQSIPYVNIGVLGTATGTVSAEDGSFTLDLQDGSGTMMVSSIGYEVVEIEVSPQDEELEVSLVSKSYNFESVNIVAHKLDGNPKVFGMDNANRGNSISYGGNFLGSELASVIVIKKPTFLKTANFVINHAKGDSMFFRVKVYDFIDGQAGENLIKKNVIIAEKQKKGLLTVDISHLDLVVENNVLLSLEWIKGQNNKGNEALTFNTKKKGKKRGVYSRHNFTDKFERMDFIRNYKPSFYFTGVSIKK